MISAAARSVSSTRIRRNASTSIEAALPMAPTSSYGSRINGVARLGRAFRPLEGNTGTNPSEVLVLQSGGSTYLAVFNFSGGSVTKSINLVRAGLDGARTYGVTDLWSGATSAARGTLTVTLDRYYAKLLQLN